MLPNELLRPKKVVIPMHYNAIVVVLKKTLRNLKTFVSVCKVEILSKD